MNQHILLFTCLIYSVMKNHNLFPLEKKQKRKAQHPLAFFLQQWFSFELIVPFFRCEDCGSFMLISSFVSYITNSTKETSEYLNSHTAYIEAEDWKLLPFLFNQAKVWNQIFSNQTGPQNIGIKSKSEIPKDPHPNWGSEFALPEFFFLSNYIKYFILKCITLAMMQMPVRLLTKLFHLISCCSCISSPVVEH